jgi:hypothetical protein
MKKTKIKNQKIALLKKITSGQISKQDFLNEVDDLNKPLIDIFFFSFRDNKYVYTGPVDLNFSNGNKEPMEEKTFTKEELDAFIEEKKKDKTRNPIFWTE